MRLGDLEAKKVVVWAQNPRNSACIVHPADDLPKNPFQPLFISVVCQQPRIHLPN